MKSLVNDARHFQIAYLASFLILGMLFLDWTENLVYYTLVLVSAQIFQYIGARTIGAKANSWKSALITSLGLCLLFKSNSYSTAILASFIAISSKFFIRYKTKHIFNPVNIGIILTTIVFQDSWISPGQWGSHLLILFSLGILGFLVLKRVDRLDASLSFFLVFGALNAFRSIFYLGWTADVLLHQLASGTLVLFTFFMITDPMTTPNHRGARIFWASAIAIVSFILSSYMFIYAAPIWVLFFAAPFTPILDHLWQSKKFEWISPKTIYKLEKN